MANLGEHWLCAAASRSGPWFTTWNHDLEDEIDEPVWHSIEDLVLDRFEEAISFRTNGGNCLVVEEVPENRRASIAKDLKGRVGDVGTREVLEWLRSGTPVRIDFDEGSDAIGALADLRRQGGKGWLSFDFFLSG